MGLNGIDFCVVCNAWCGSVTFGDKVKGGGTMRKNCEGELEIICNDCLAIEQSHAVPIKPGSRSGFLVKDATNG